MKEQEIEKAEQVRLDEILNMCAEYEKQSQQCEKNKPTPNRYVIKSIHLIFIIFIIFLLFFSGGIY